MNVKEYIESGILEAYVLGALVENERVEVEAAMLEYPEVAAEVAAIEAAMQAFAESTPKTPPVHLEDKIWEALGVKEDKEEENKTTTTEPQIIPLTKRTSSTPTWARAAVWAALIGSVLVNIMLWSQRNQMQQQQVALKNQIDTIQGKQQQLAQIVNHYQEEKSMLADTAMQTVVMRTAQKGHPMAATIYWSKGKGEAYLAIDKLPEPPKGMQYQLWVIQNGKPVDMGVLPNTLIQSAGMQKIDKQVLDGQAFAISLEKEGGSPVPTMENIYVMGKTS